MDRLNEIVATDTFFSSVAAHDDGIMGHGGATMAQLYVGTSSHLTAVFPMSSESQMHATLMDFIRMHGAPNMLLSDAKTQISSKVIDILRHYHIKQHRSEPYYQNQNLAEQRIQDCKHLVNNIMDRTGTPAKFWLLCLEYAVYVLNHTCEVKDTKTPLEKAHGQPVDVSALMQFRWFEPVLYHAPDASFPSESTEKLGRWVGVADHVGDALTYLILDDASQLVVPRSVVRTALSAQHPNLRATTPQQDGEESGGVITSVTDLLPPSVDPAEVSLPHLLPHELLHELLGKTFLHTTQDGEQGTSDQESQRF